MRSTPFGFLLIDKPVGWTSFDVCAKLRKQLGTKKIGHTGTLDPFATGLLLVAVGKATKLIPFLEKDIKVYETKIQLGVISETLDTESEITSTNKVNNNIDQGFIEKILNEQFTGEITQIPPKYSALKIGGKKMCDLARAGKDFEIKSRKTVVHAIEVLSFEKPFVTIRLSVAAGFYVRSFARDLGEALGFGGGICTALRRMEVGDLKVISSLKPIESITRSDLISPENILRLPRVVIDTGRADDFLHGRAFPFETAIEGKFMVFAGDKFLGIGEKRCGNLQPRIGFR